MARLMDVNPQARRFFTMREGQPIAIIQGESGFYPITTMDGDDVESRLCDCNMLFGNTEKDIDDAVSCSMFGWDIPAGARFAK